MSRANGAFAANGLLVALECKHETRPRRVNRGARKIMRRAWTCLKGMDEMIRCSILFAALLAGPAFAQDAVPTASTADAPICTDRPTKSNFACTVPKGKVQIEADTFNWLSNTATGVRTEQLLFTNPTYKYGLTDSSDIQLNWAPFTRVWRRDAN